MLSVLARHLKLLSVWGLVVAVIAAGISLLFPLQYSAVSQVLIISRGQGGVDPYTQAKAAERVGENLSEVMRTSDFYGKVMESAVSFDKDSWKKLTERAARKKWQKDVRPESVYGTSLLKVTVYGPTQAEAISFSNAVTQTVASRGWEYVGGDVVLKQVDNPLVSRLPTRPNLIVNAVAGFFIGVFLSGLWLVWYKKHTWFSKV